MLATLTGHYFSDPEWIFERKLDGERCLAFRRGGEVRLLSRSRQHLNSTYPEIVDGLSRPGAPDVVIDGEVVAFEGDRTSFERLQQRLGITNAAEARRSPVAVFYYIFDLLYLDGYDTTALSLRDRKTLLKAALQYTDALRFTPHRNETGEAYFQFACAHGWEGLVAKRASSTVRIASVAGLAEVQVLPRPGVCSRRVYRPGRQPRRPGRPPGRLLRPGRAGVRRQGRHRFFHRHLDGSAPATGCSRYRQATLYPGPYRGAGCSLGAPSNWWPRWCFPSGPRTANCGTLATKGSGPTKRPARCNENARSARRRRHLGPVPRVWTKPPPWPRNRRSPYTVKPHKSVRRVRSGPVCSVGTAVTS